MIAQKIKAGVIFTPAFLCALFHHLERRAPAWAHKGRSNTLKLEHNLNSN